MNDDSREGAVSSKTAHARPLAGRGIVITRPRDQAETLTRVVAEYGGVPIVLPAIDILDVEDPSRLHAFIDRLDAFDPVKVVKEDE